MFKFIPSGAKVLALAVVGTNLGWLAASKLTPQLVVARGMHQLDQNADQNAGMKMDISSPASALLTQSAETPQKFVVRNIPREQFCKSVQGMLAMWGTGAGFDERRSAIMATSVTSELVDSFRTGRATELIDQKALVRLMNRERADMVAPGYIPLAAFLAPAMGTRPQSTSVALSAADLRFVPHTQRGTDIVVIAQTAAPLTPERARTVADVARRLDIRLSVVWVGGLGREEESINGESSNEARNEERNALAFLTSITGGGFVDLGGDGCGRNL